MSSLSRVFWRLVLVAVSVMLAHVSMAQPLAINGTWKLDEKNSRNVSDQAKGIDLAIVLTGKTLSTQRLFEGAKVGEPLVVQLDGVPIEREIAKGVRGTIEARWRANGKLIEMIIKTRQSNLIDLTQTTAINVSEDGKVMTRTQTRKGGGETNESVLIYRRKE